MKQIIKRTDEPEKLVVWRVGMQETIDRYISDGKSGEHIWGLLPSSKSKEELEDEFCKAEFREILVKEQYHLCCYCNFAIKGSPLDTKLEHYLPKELYLNQAFDYYNLFAACDGGTHNRVKGEELNCDSHKGKNDPSIKSLCSPLEIGVESHFRFERNGVMSGQTEKGKSTVNFLNLDSKRLRLMRKSAIEDFYDDEKTAVENLHDAITPFNGRLPSFSTAIAFVLREQHGL